MIYQNIVSTFRLHCCRNKFCSTHSDISEQYWGPKSSLIDYYMLLLFYLISFCFKFKCIPTAKNQIWTLEIRDNSILLSPMVLIYGGR